MNKKNKIVHFIKNKKKILKITSYIATIVLILLFFFSFFIKNTNITNLLNKIITGFTLTLSITLSAVLNITYNKLEINALGDIIIVNGKEVNTLEEMKQSIFLLSKIKVNYKKINELFKKVLNEIDFNDIKVIHQNRYSHILSIILENENLTEELIVKLSVLTEKNGGEELNHMLLTVQTINYYLNQLFINQNLFPLRIITYENISKDNFKGCYDIFITLYEDLIKNYDKDTPPLLELINP